MRVKAEVDLGGIRFSNPQRRGTLECGAALDVFHVTLFGKLSQAPCEFLHYAFFSKCAGAPRSIFGAGKSIPQFLACRDSSISLGDVQQRFGRNEAAVETHAAGISVRGR